MSEQTSLPEKPSPEDQETTIQEFEDVPNEVFRSTRRLTREAIQASVAARKAYLPKPVKILRQGLLRLEMMDTRQAITIPIKPVINLGRPDPTTNTMPDVDFTALAGYRMGVSRTHAQIVFAPNDNILRLCDLGSSNGTYLNGERLSSRESRPLYNGDEIRLGQLAMYVYYEIQDAQTLIPIRGLDAD